MILTAAVFLPFSALVTCFGITVTLFAAAFFAAAFLVSLFLLKKRPRAVFITVLALILTLSSVFSFLFKSELARTKDLEGEIITLNATVLTAPELKNGAVTFKVYDGNASNGFIEIFSEDLSLIEKISVGSRLKCEAISLISSEGESKKSLSELVFLKASPISEPQISSGNAFPVLRFVSNLRERVTSFLSEKVGGENGILASAMISGKGGDGAISMKYFRASGISHYFAVSGFHISVLSSSLFFLLGALGVTKRRAFLFSLPVLLFSVIFADFSPSVMRAAVMCLFVLISETFLENRSLLNTLSFTALLFLLFNPYLLYSASFLLSFSAVLGIAFSVKALSLITDRRFKSYRRKKAVKAVLSPVFVSLFAALFTFPASLYFFGYLPIYSVLANLLTSFAVSVAFTLILLLCALSFLPFAGEILGSLIDGIMNFLVFASKSIAELPFSRVALSFEEAVCIAVIFFSLFLAVFAFKKRKFKALSLSAAVIFTLFSLTALLLGNQKCRLTVRYTEGVKSVAVTSRGESLLYLFDKPEDPDKTAEIALSHGISSFVTVVNGNPEGLPTEISAGKLKIGFFRKDSDFSVFISAKNKNIALFPSGFSPNELYKTAFYDIIICEGKLNNPDMLAHSGAKRLYSFDYSLSRRNLLEEMCKAHGIAFSPVYYGEGFTLYFE